MGYPIISYGAIVAFNALAIIIMAKVAPNIVKIIGLNKTCYLGISLIVFGGLSMLLINYVLLPTLITLMVPVFITTMGAGIIRPIANGGAMQLAPKKAIGSAAACFNFISFGSGAIVSIFSLKLVTNILEFGVFILIFGILSILLMWITFNVVKVRSQHVNTPN